jgi:hypothetical protein
MSTLAVSEPAAPSDTAAFPTAPISLNSANWSSKAGFLSGVPGWCEEAGFVDPDEGLWSTAVGENGYADPSQP